MDYNKRRLQENISRDLARKMVFLAGPRQCGKTSTAKHLLTAKTGDLGRYLNWDISDHRSLILEERFPPGAGLIVLDEIHKYSRWRQVVKGLYDLRKDEVSVLVTGSGKLDHYSHGGDSLQGRYFLTRMFPFSLDELTGDKRENLNRIFKFGPFPEPLLFGEEDFAMRWNRDYIHRLVEEDVASLENLHDLGLLQLLASRLKNLIGSPISINALREDLQVAHKTVAHWLEILEALYYHFRIYPFGAPLIRAVKKEAKLYLFDWLPIQNQGSRFENMIAFHLFKAICEKVDSTGEEWELRYFRDVDGREVDFLITLDGIPKFAVEAKVQDEKKHISSNYIKKKFPDCAGYLVFYEPSTEYTDKIGITHLMAENFILDYLPKLL